MIIKSGKFYKIYKHRDKTYSVVDEDEETVKPIRYNKGLDKKEAVRIFEELDKNGEASEKQVAYLTYLETQLKINKTKSILGKAISRKKADSAIKRYIKETENLKFNKGTVNTFGATVIDSNDKFILYKDKDGTYCIRGKPESGWRSNVIKDHQGIKSLKKVKSIFKDISDNISDQDEIGEE